MDTPTLDLGLLKKSKVPSRRGGLDLGLLDKSKVPSRRGGLDLGLSEKSNPPLQEGGLDFGLPGMPKGCSPQATAHVKIAQNHGKNAKFRLLAALASVTTSEASSSKMASARLRCVDFLHNYDFSRYAAQVRCIASGPPHSIPR